MSRALDTILNYGLIAVLIWTPLAFGSVHLRAYSLMEIHIFLLIVAWMSRIIVDQRLPIDSQTSSVRLPCLPGAFPFGLFIALLLFQIIPLPQALIRPLSSSTNALYDLFLPDWPDIWQPLSLHPYATRLGLLKCLAYASLFYLIINTVKTQRALRSVYLTIVGAATLMALLGIVQKLSGTSSIYGLYDTGTAVFFGPYLNRNHFAGYQAIAIQLALGLLFTQPGNPSSSLPHSWHHRVIWFYHLFSAYHILIMLSIVMMTGALFLSLSRGGVLSFFFGIILFALLLRKRLKGANYRAMFATTLLIMAGMILWLGVTPLFERFTHVNPHDKSLLLGDRVPVSLATWQMAKDFPLFGVGYEAFSVIFPRYKPETVRLPYEHAHNDFLQLLAETGWIGFSTLIGGLLSLIIAIVKCWQRQRDPFGQIMVPAGLAALGAASLHAQADFNLHIPANALLSCATLALTFTAAHLSHPRDTAYAF